MEVRPVAPEDEPRWRELWKGYCDFYEATVPEDVTAETWRRLLDPEHAVSGFVAVNGNGQVVGFTHYIAHPLTWSAALTCYLEDLFVDPETRGGGGGRALIDAVIACARKEGWAKVYWHTRESNAPARKLYDSFVEADDFVRYVVKTT